jgi:hypothetical protein
MTANSEVSSQDNRKLGSTGDAMNDKATTSHNESGSTAPDATPALGTVGPVVETDEKVEHSAAALENHPVENETSVKIDKDESTTTTEEKLTKKDEEAAKEKDDNENDDTVYPGGLQLALLTFGLW